MPTLTSPTELNTDDARRFELGKLSPTSDIIAWSASALSGPNREISSIRYLPASPSSDLLSITKTRPEPVAAVMNGTTWRRRSVLVRDLNNSSSRNGAALAPSILAASLITVTGFLYAIDLTGSPPCPPAALIVVPGSDGFLELYMWTGILHSAAGWTAFGWSTFAPKLVSSAASA